MNFDIKYKEKDVVEGLVMGIKNYGVFLSFEAGYIGLLHISEISHNYISNIYSLFEIGEKFPVIIQSIDHKNKFLKLSIKDLPESLKIIKNESSSRKIISYINDIDFSKLKIKLPQMIKKELERINI